MADEQTGADDLDADSRLRRSLRRVSVREGLTVEERTREAAHGPDPHVLSDLASRML